MSPEPEQDDDALLAELASALRLHDGPPADLLESAKGLFTWRTIDAELAALTFDSLLDDEPAAVRSTGTAPRLLTFEASGTAIELEIESGDVRRLVGQVVPPRSGEVALTVDGRTERVPVDEIGRFVVGLPDEPQRIRLVVTVDGQDISVVVVA